MKVILEIAKGGIQRLSPLSASPTNTTSLSFSNAPTTDQREKGAKEFYPPLISPSSVIRPVQAFQLIMVIKYAVSG